MTPPGDGWIKNNGTAPGPPEQKRWIAYCGGHLSAQPHAVRALRWSTTGRPFDIAFSRKA